MKKHVASRKPMELTLSNQNKLSRNFNLHQAKFAAATKRAEELLSQPAPLGINDSLNCGKFNAKFVKEIRKSLLG
ncbi:hypothetical protein [Sporomusa aerivorans]|uniref:hypothetical protein n=1 Tax=Sporomusa aerivorans TaxID=204936 RepID=UPI00352BB2F4